MESKRDLEFRAKRGEHYNFSKYSLPIAFLRGEFIIKRC